MLKTVGRCPAGCLIKAGLSYPYLMILYSEWTSLQQGRQMFSLQSSLVFSSYHVLEAILIKLKGCADYLTLIIFLGGTMDFLLDVQPWLAITYFTQAIRGRY